MGESLVNCEERVTDKLRQWSYQAVASLSSEFSKQQCQMTMSNRQHSTIKNQQTPSYGVNDSRVGKRIVSPDSTIKNQQTPSYGVNDSRVGKRIVSPESTIKSQQTPSYGVNDSRVTKQLCHQTVLSRISRYRVTMSMTAELEKGLCH
ncbi:hypothetical protein RRG08_002068 [Elysia crispata]|uniref:Uncharacterized protein n=1 Tax=Elysia crispata TaxID=231223 RepID=A0AAE0ZKA8_9GAST|nr:hypothetical protein RRG08_002068 [Elysia crispata]